MLKYPESETTRSLFFRVIVLFSVYVLPAQAVYAAEEIIVTSSRVPMPARQVGTSVTVLNEDSIQAYGNFSLVDILRQQPGVNTSNNGGAGQTTSLRIRGEEGFRTLVILDGMRLLDASAPQITGHVEHLLSTGIEQVEVLRGPQGLSYGADAGGVVSIGTLGLDDRQSGQVSFQGGDYGTRLLAGNFSGGFEKANFHISISDLHTDGFNSRRDDTEFRDNDGYDNTTLHINSIFDLSPDWKLQLTHRDVEGEVEYDGCGFPAVHDCLSDFNQSASRIALENSNPDLSHSLSWATVDTSRLYYTEGAFAFSGESELRRAEYLGTLNSLPGLNLVFGADYEEAVGGEMSRDNLGIYLEYLSNFSDSMFLTIGLRHDENEDFGSNMSYRLSSVWLNEISDSSLLKLRGSYGTGFRAPSPYEIDYNSGPFAYPPASLVALNQETSKGYEIGAEYLSEIGARLEVVFFDQEVEDAIEFDLTGFSGYLQDVGVSSSRGIELVGELPLNSTFMLRGNYTWNDTERPDGTQRLLRPEQLINLGVSWAALQDRLDVGAWLRASRGSIDESGQMDDFEVVDMRIAYQLTNNLQLVSRFENLFDEDYQEVRSYNTPGRAVYFGFSINFPR